MDWPKNYPFSIKNDFWIDTSKEGKTARRVVSGNECLYKEY
jgi:hypothetical protein